MARAVLGVFPPEMIATLLEELAAAGVDPACVSVAVSHQDEGGPGPLSGSFRGFRPLHVDGARKLDGAGPVAERAERFGLAAPYDGKANGSLVRAITKEGIPEIVARAYVRELEQGGAFLSARVPGARVGKVVALMNRHTGRTVATAGDELEEDLPVIAPATRVVTRVAS